MTDYSIRLTPGDAPGYIAEYSRVNDVYCHQIRLNGGRQVIPLSPAEALTFARQLPEVKALVEAAQAMSKCKLQFWVEWEAIRRHLAEALAPFQEAPDA